MLTPPIPPLQFSLRFDDNNWRVYNECGDYWCVRADLIDLRHAIIGMLKSNRRHLGEYIEALEKEPNP